MLGHRVDVTALSTYILNMSLKRRSSRPILPAAAPLLWPTVPSFPSGTPHDAPRAEQLSAGDLQMKGCLSRCEHLSTGREEKAQGGGVQRWVLNSALCLMNSVTSGESHALSGLCSVSGWL